MELFEPIVLVASPIILAAYVCRLAMLSFRTNKPAVILFHMALAISTGWAGYRAYLGETVFGDLAAVAGAGLWIYLSFGSWRRGVPDHFDKHPDPLNTEDWIKVHGGRKQ